MSLGSHKRRHNLVKMKKKSTKGQVENILAELGKKIDQLIKDAKGAKDTIRNDLEVKIEELKQKKAKIEEDFKSYQEKHEGKWDDVKEHLEKALNELKMAASSAFKKKEDK